MSIRTTVRLAPELLRAAKEKAAKDGRTLASLIEDGLRQIVNERKTEVSETRPFKLRVSKARGGLRPGFDLTDMSTFYDAEDAEVAALVAGPNE